MKLRWFVFLGIVIFVMVIVYGITISYLINDEGNRGTFGDMFGAINALFSGLAFAGIIYTILLQREELSLQREEIKNSIKELAGQKEEMKRQRFESTFFSLINAHQEVVRSTVLMRIESVMLETPVVGKQAFTYLISELVSIMETSSEKSDPPYKILYRKYIDVLFGYYGSVRSIYSFVDESEFTFDEKHTYLQYFRNQLTPNELSLILEHCNIDNQMRILLDRYDFSQQMSDVYIAPYL